jgi:hypothetical protein
MAYNTGNEKDSKTILANKKSYQDFIKPYKKYINFINFTEINKIHYGFKDKNNLDIIPKDSKIIFDDEYNIVGLDFFIFAYKELAEKYYSLLRDGQIASNSTINKALSNPKISEVGLDFEPTLKQNYEEFNDKVITDLSLNMTTKNIFDYMNAYSNYIPNLKSKTQTELKYINSNKVKNINAITMTLTDKKLNNDQEKVKFISDLNFPVLRKLAEQYGFYIDQNIPWQLTANLAHPNIQSIVSTLYPDTKKANITPDFIVENYYNELIFIDYEKQKDFFLTAYSALYNKRKKFSEAFLCQKVDETRLNVVYREIPPDKESFMLKTNELIFLNTYLRILNAENNFKYDDVKLNEIFYQVKKLYTGTLDTKKALVYIYSKFEPVAI